MDKEMQKEWVYRTKVEKAIKEASISIACLLDGNWEEGELDKDLEHIQTQITILENHFDNDDYDVFYKP